jgi:hypothetical protein
MFKVELVFIALVSALVLAQKPLSTNDKVQLLTVFEQIGCDSLPCPRMIDLQGPVCWSHRRLR